MADTSTSEMEKDFMNVDEKVNEVLQKLIIPCDAKHALRSHLKKKTLHLMVE
jgi:hypothetical protein